MSKINKIKVSGTSYDLEDKNAAKSVTLTQAEYDALVSAGTVDQNTFYVISDSEFSMDDYWTSAETQSAITEAVSGKQDTTAVTQSITEATSGKVDSSSVVSSVTSASTDSEIPTAKAVWDAIPTGGTGGGKAISAGTNISVTTGETADTVSCTLNAKTGSKATSFIAGFDDAIATGYWCAAFGNGQALTNYTFAANGRSIARRGYSAAFNNSEANNTYAFSTGAGTIANGYSSFVGGWYVNTYNEGEASVGRYNNSVSASTTFGDSGNTLFSVGNGTTDNARHNAFEIRQNGDIYLTKDGVDIKLQDNLGSTVEVSSAITSGDTNAIAGGAVYDKFDEVEQVTAAALNNINDRLSEDEEVTAAGLNAVNDKFDGLKLKKLTQSQYDALSGNTDSNTLYVIVN